MVHIDNIVQLLRRPFVAPSVPQNILPTAPPPRGVRAGAESCDPFFVGWR